MPLLKVTTNIEITEVNTFASHASAFTAELLGKPESYVMVNIEAGKCLIFAGSNEPTAHVKLKSLGLQEEKTAEFSAKLCTFLNDKLGIEPNRIYIEFSSPERHMWGWDSRTF